MRYKHWTGIVAAGLVFSICTVFASDWTVITGQVTKVRQGSAAFYTITAQDGTQYIANSAHPHVRQNETVFKNAYADKKSLHIEFQSHANNPGSIWNIRLIEPAVSVFEAPPETAGTVQETAAPVLLPKAESCDFRVSGIFRDGMVLQRGMPVPVWGRAKPGAEITVEFAGQKKTGKAGGDGRWQIKLDSMEASSAPREMTVRAASGSRKLSIGNILVGEVWVLAGQSNMEWWLQASKGGSDAAARADYPWLRVFDPGWQLPDEPAPDVTERAAWTTCTPETAGQISAIGFFFAGQLHQALGVPLGLLRTSVSGTYGECWLSREAIESIPEARPRLDEYQAALKILPEETARWEKEKAEYNLQAAEARKNGSPDPAMSFFVKKGPMGPNHFHRPYGLYNGRIAPVMPCAVRGVIWYQGEGNSQNHRVGYYKELLTALIDCWRKGWQCGNLPFLIVQLPRFEAGPNNDWPKLREAQRAAAAEVHDAGLVVTIDTGEAGSIHPADKRPVGDRIAKLALQQVYKQPVSGRSSLPAGICRSGDSLLIRFSDVGERLISREGPPRCFEIAGSNDVFISAEAEIILPDRIKLTSPQVQHPAKVRYAYSDFPDVNLFNSAGLPAAPFCAEVSE
ncbi:MAG: sialate O-acetylesterase [Kiritimatiellales bacterium]